MERPIRPRAQILEALKGEISEPIETVSKKPGFVDRTVSVKLVKEGPGMVGLGDAQDNKEWSGIFNHFVKTAGAAVNVGKLLELNGEEVDAQLLLDTILVSHSGRRHYDESTWYPEAVENAEEKSKKSDTELGLPLLRAKGLDGKVIEMVAVHGLGSTYPFEQMDSWNKKLPMYLDFRIAQNAMGMEQRFTDLQRGVTVGRYTQEALDRLHEWARQTENELFKALRLNSYEALVANQPYLKARVDVARKLDRFTGMEEKVIRESRAYSGKQSGKEADIAGQLGLSKEEFLGWLQLRPDDINDNLLKSERWERYLRRLYINDAEDGIYELYLQADREDTQTALAGFALNQEVRGTNVQRAFPRNTWWGNYVIDLANDVEKFPYLSMSDKPQGIQRAIEFFRKLDEQK